MGRTRRRPRVRSISLRSFHWAVARQACFQCFPTPPSAQSERLVKLIILPMPLAKVRRVTRGLLLATLQKGIL